MHVSIQERIECFRKAAASQWFHIFHGWATQHRIFLYHMLDHSLKTRISNASLTPTSSVDILKMFEKFCRPRVCQTRAQVWIIFRKATRIVNRRDSVMLVSSTKFGEVFEGATGRNRQRTIPLSKPPKQRLFDANCSDSETTSTVTSPEVAG